MTPCAPAIPDETAKAIKTESILMALFPSFP
jgi:hypothetical protein